MEGNEKKSKIELVKRNVRCLRNHQPSTGKSILHEKIGVKKKEMVEYRRESNDQGEIDRQPIYAGKGCRRSERRQEGKVMKEGNVVNFRRK